jgi:hypothetical protein
MRRLFIMHLLLGTGLAALGQGQTPPSPIVHPQDLPQYRISFEPKEPVAGIDAPPAFKLPFECTTDGTAFITTLPVGGLRQPPRYAPPPLLLVSVSLSGQAHTFPIDQPTQQLHNVREIDHYASDSAVVFLIEAAREDKPIKRTYTKSDGTSGEYSDNGAERHMFLLFFDRDGNFKKTSELDVGFKALHVGVFPSGTLLALGYDREDHSTKLAMVKEDGTLFRSVQVEKGDVPDSMLGAKDGSGKGPAAYVAQAEFAPFGHSIILVQNRSAFPLLEVSESGATRAIHPQLPKGLSLESVIASDHNLFARVTGSKQGSIYEIDPQSGAVTRQFELRSDEDSASVACIHDGKFLSFDHGEGKLVPLIGTPELSRSTAIDPRIKPLD